MKNPDSAKYLDSGIIAKTLGVRECKHPLDGGTVHSRGLIEQIKRECWDGENQHPKGKILNLKQDRLLVTAAGIQKQIDSTQGTWGRVFVLDSGVPMQIRSYAVEKDKLKSTNSNRKSDD